MGLTAQDIMNRGVVCAREDMTIGQLIELLRDSRISGAPVLDAEGNLVGVVSTSDILLRDEDVAGSAVLDSDYHTSPGDAQDGEEVWDALTSGEMTGRSVRDIMSPAIITGSPNTPIEELASMMYCHRIHRLIIVEEGQMAGIVTTMDILKTVMDKKVS